MKSTVRPIQLSESPLQKIASEFISISERKDGEYTLEDYAETRGITVSKARTEVKHQIELGKLEWTNSKRLINRHWTRVFVIK